MDLADNYFKFVLDSTNACINWYFDVFEYFLGKTSIFFHNSASNLFILLFRIFMLLCLLLLVFHIPIYMIIVYNSKVTFWGYLMRAIITIILSFCFATYARKQKIIYKSIFLFFFDLFHLITWISCFVFYIFSFDRIMLDFIFFKNNLTSYAQIFSVFVSNYSLFLEQKITFILMYLHFSTPFGIIRMSQINKLSPKGTKLEYLLDSFFISIIIDPLLVIFYFFNLLFPIRFYISHKKFFTLKELFNIKKRKSFISYLCFYFWSWAYV